MKRESFLTQHLHDADESYFEHLGFTIKVGVTLIVAALLAMIHGLFPFILTHTASTMLCRLTSEMQARKNACEARHRAKSSDEM